MKRNLCNLIFGLIVLNTIPLNADLLNDTMVCLDHYQCITQVPTSETYSVGYMISDTGVNIQIASYTNFVVATALDGPEQHKQIIMQYNGVLLDCSNSISCKKDHFEHKYPWGRVTSYPNHQIIKHK